MPPRQRLRKNMKPSSQEKPNCRISTADPPRPATTAPRARNTMPATIAMTGSLRQRERSREFVEGVIGCEAMLFQPRFQLRRHLIDRSKMAALQGADIGDDR